MAITGRGGTVAVLKYNLKLIKDPDCIIDRGPEAWPELDPGASNGGGE